MKLNELGRLIETAPHRAEVEEFLRPATFGSRRLRRYLRREWRRYNTDRIDDIRAAALQELTELPFSEVLADGVTYRIHGIIHDQRSFGLRMQADVRNVLLAFVEAFDGPAEGYVLEHGFGKNFGLPRDREAGSGATLFAGMDARTVVIFCAKVLAMIPILPLAPFFARTTSDAAYRQLWKALRDVRHLPAGRELYRFTHLPEPLATELESGVGARVVWKMSSDMAQAMRVRAAEKGWTLVHCVCGLAHEPQIVSCLKGESPSFSIRPSASRPRR